MRGRNSTLGNSCAMTGTTSFGALASQAVGGGVAGAIVAAIVGVIKNKMTA